MLYKSSILVFLVSILFSCGEKSKFSKNETAQQDQAWATMMEGHDRVMPEIDHMYQLGKAIEKIAENNMVAADDTHPRAMEALKALETADDAMMDWMANISENQLSALRTREMDHAALMAFIAKEQINIDAVEEAMVNSIKQAEALVQEKTGN